MLRPPSDAASTQTPWRSPELHIHEPGRPPRRVRLNHGGTWVLGRSSGCHIELRDTRLSRRHLRLIVTPDRPLGVDLGSRTGTCRGDERLPPDVEVELHDGDTLRLGRTRVRIQWYAQRLARFADRAELPEQTELPQAEPAQPPSDFDAPREDAVEASTSSNRSDTPPGRRQPVPAAGRPDGPQRRRLVRACWFAAAVLFVLAAGVMALAASRDAADCGGTQR